MVGAYCRRPQFALFLCARFPRFSSLKHGQEILVIRFAVDDTRDLTAIAVFAGGEDHLAYLGVVHEADERTILQFNRGIQGARIYFPCHRNYASRRLDGATPPRSAMLSATLR